jgi:hypothetical protein
MSRFGDRHGSSLSLSKTGAIAQTVDRNNDFLLVLTFVIGIFFHDFAFAGAAFVWHADVFV